MKKYLLLIAALVLPLLIYGQQRPNIVVFMVDDMGWMDTSVPFGDSVMARNKLYHTPNMERLASQGMKFTNAYATPVCTPTRVSMVTGMNVAHHAVTNWTSPWRDRNSDNRDEELLPVPWNLNGLSPVEGVAETVYATPLPQLLKEAGYFTVHVGKAHWASAGTPGASPYNLGFMVNIAGHVAGRPQSYLGTENFGNREGEPFNIHAVPDLTEYFGTDTFLTEALTLEAIKSLEAPIQNKQAFFLNMSHYAVHDPYNADRRFVQKYREAGMGAAEAKYASMLEGMDKSLGDIMDYLETKKVEDNTIILFLSDNGALSLAYARAGEPHTQNHPLKAGKGSVYEGGIRVPMLVKWPGVVEPASASDQPVIIEDFFPSILEMARIKKYDVVQEIDGKSFVPLLKKPSAKQAERALIWHMPHKWIRQEGPGINYKSAIRQGDWKLIYNMRNGQMELYNLRSDIGEKTDLASNYPKKTRALATRLGRQLREWNAPMPVFKSTNESVPMPDELLHY
jgi:arylsulfatase A-like enzyme